MTRIAFIGLGTMGLPMAHNVLRAGYDLTVYDIMPDPVERLAADGARAAGSPREAAEGCDVVITMLPTSREVEAAVLEEDGVYAGLAPGSVHIEMSTIEPSATRRFAASAEQRGIRVMDAPVGKSSAAAAAGDLTIMVGGPAELLEEHRALLSTMGSTIHHCGEVGAGEVVKLVNNLVTGGICVVVAEAIVLGTKAGADPNILVDVMGGTLAGNAQLESLFRASVFKGAFEPGFKTRLMLKDARLGVGMADELNVPVPVCALVKELYGTAVQRGLGDRDFGSYTTLVEEVAGVQARVGEARSQTATVG
jgi:4-hydroxybutyrate dehydrogenase / sulfolactaldehyde 3-reductase